MAQPDDIISRVERLTADYIGCIDDDALERWPTFFTEDGLYRIVSRENYARGPASELFILPGTGHDAGSHPVAAAGQHLRAAHVSPSGLGHASDP